MKPFKLHISTFVVSIKYISILPSYRVSNYEPEAHEPKVEESIMVQYHPRLPIVQYSRAHKYRSHVKLVSWEIDKCGMA